MADIKATYVSPTVWHEQVARWSGPSGRWRNAAPAEVRLWGRCDVDEDGCWVEPNSTGYGLMRWKGRTVQAHRLAWEVANGEPIPDGLIIRHSCDKPPCRNPAHLLLGTHADNTADKMTRGRFRPGVLPDEARERARQRLIERNRSPEHRQRISEAWTKKDPREAQALVRRRAQTRRQTLEQNPAIAEAISDRLKRQWADPEWKKNQIAATAAGRKSR